MLFLACFEQTHLREDLNESQHAAVVAACLKSPAPFVLLQGSVSDPLKGHCNWLFFNFYIYMFDAFLYTCFLYKLLYLLVPNRLYLFRYLENHSGHIIHFVSHYYVDSAGRPVRGKPR